jgi:hypothetical protein
METRVSSWENEVRERQEFRSGMVQAFAFTVMDHGLAMARCPNCKSLSAVNCAFPNSDWNSLYHLVSVLETFIESKQYEIVCAECEDEIVGEGGMKAHEYWLWHSHYLAEVNKDIQLLLYRRDGMTIWIEGMLVEPDGAITPTTLPCSEVEFLSKAGCHFSVRQAWKEFLQNHWPVSKFAGTAISQGYFLVVSPPVDADSDLVDFKDSCVKLVADAQPNSGHYEFADLSWADEFNFEESTYHGWLNDYETDLQESNVIAGVLASPDQFYNIVNSQLERFGCGLRREDEEQSVAFLGDDEYYLSFNYREYLINAMIKGYGYWGALRYIEPILDSWEKAKYIGEQLKELLQSYSCTVFGGHYFQARNKKGKKEIIKELDLTGLEQPDEDFRTQEDFAQWIAPQISLNLRTCKFDSAQS